MSEDIVAAGAGKPARTLDMVTAEIKFLDAQAGRLVMGHALEIGRRLREAKDLVPYGGWGEYLEKQLGYTQTTANKLMKVYDEYGASQMGLFGPEIDSETFTNLTYSKALALLSVPREEREQFAREVDAEHLSTRELQAAIRERDEAKKALEEAKEELSETAEMLDKTMEERNARGVIIREHEESLAAMEKELAELKARPVEVAVQEPDPAEVEKRAAELAAKAQKAQAEAEQAAAAARAEAEQKIKKANEKAKAEREKLEAQLKEAEGKLAAAGAEDKAEAEKLRAEAEALRKQLAMSNQATVVFKLRFMAWQQAHQQMSEAFAALDEETKEKMRAAIRAQIKAWGWGE